jgi:hypothetical protein
MEVDDWIGIDWVDYFHHLSDDEIRELAAWLAAEFLGVGEFTDIVDRVYVWALDDWRGREPAFVTLCKRSVVEAYAGRKRRFTELMAALEDAQMSGALSGDVVPQELQPLRPPWSGTRTAEQLLGALERARGGAG